MSSEGSDLRAALDALRDLLNERDRRYEQALNDHKELDDRRHAAESEAIDAALQANQLAINKAEAATEKRFESVNEFRQQLGDQAATFMLRKEYEVRHDALSARVDTMATSLHREIETLQRSATLSEGRHKGISMAAAVIVSTVALIGTIIGIVATLAALNQ